MTLKKNRSISWATTLSNMQSDGVLMAYMMVKNGGLISNRFRAVNQWGVQTDSHTHTHTHTYTHMHTDTLRRMESARMKCVAFGLKIRLQANTPWHILAKGSPSQQLTPLNIEHIVTCHVFDSNFYLKNESQGRWQLNDNCENTYVCKNWRFQVQPFVRGT